jgi:hypothetical protein
MGGLFALARALFGHLPLCALAGGLVGVITGFFTGLYEIGNPTLVLSGGDQVRLGLALGLVGWLVVLFILAAWFRYRLGGIALPALVTALLTGVITVLILEALHLPALSVPIGLVAGIAIGFVLCAACRRLGVDPGRPSRG